MLWSITDASALVQEKVSVHSLLQGAGVGRVWKTENIMVFYSIPSSTLETSWYLIHESQVHSGFIMMSS
jgi:hypothetical protein